MKLRFELDVTPEQAARIFRFLFPKKESPKKDKPKKTKKKLKPRKCSICKKVLDPPVYGKGNFKCDVCKDLKKWENKAEELKKDRKAEELNRNGNKEKPKGRMIDTDAYLENAYKKMEEPKPKP